jgi:hypothetical protein
VGQIPKPKVLENLVEIGIDEFNNGHHRKDLPEISVAYTRYPFEDRPSSAGEKLSKGLGFREGPKKDAWMKRADVFVEKFHRFKYCTVDRTEDPVQKFHRKTLAIARLILESYLFLEERYARPDRFVLIMDGAQFGDGNGLRSKEIIEDHIREYGIESEVFFRPHADQGQRHPAVYVADRLAYVIGAKHFDDPWKNWPYLERRVDLDAPPPVTAEEINRMVDLLEIERRSRHK